MKAAVMALGAALLAACSTGPAAAAGAQVCTARAGLLAALEKRHGQHPVAVGVTNDGQLIEVVTEQSGRTWSIVVTEPGGESCVLSSGHGWQQLGPKLGRPT